MTKQDLVNYIAAEVGLTKADATRTLDAFMSGVEKGLKKDGKVAITGFMTFTKQHKAARTGRNPRTGETVKIAARNAVNIKAGSKLKDAIK